MSKDLIVHLKKYRLEHELTQEDLAVAVNVSRQTINAIEKGKYNPSLDLAIRLARVFNVSVETLFTLKE